MTQFTPRFNGIESIHPILSMHIVDTSQMTEGIKLWPSKYCRANEQQFLQLVKFLDDNIEVGNVIVNAETVFSIKSFGVIIRFIFMCKNQEDLNLIGIFLSSINYE